MAFVTKSADVRGYDAGCRCGCKGVELRVLPACRCFVSYVSTRKSFQDNHRRVEVAQPICKTQSIEKVKRVDVSSEDLEANMRQMNNRECRMRSVVGTLGLLAIGYMLVKNLPDIVRYIRISSM